MIKTYSELIKLPTFKERFRYLMLSGNVGKTTFGYDRYLNQNFYRSSEWKTLRDKIIVRDDGCEFGLKGYEIRGRVLIHHMNPITDEDICDASEYLMNPEYLICVSHDIHNALHYGNEDIIFFKEPIVRRPNDTIPWKE